MIRSPIPVPKKEAFRRLAIGVVPENPTRTAASVGSGGSGGRPEYAGILTGRRLARFEVRGLLGAGGFGEVYRARDTRLDRVVAIKVLPAEVAQDADRRERFRREAIAASGLNHPNICTVHDLVEAEGHWLIVMELVEGETLHERLKAGSLPVEEALPIAVQIAEALGEAHRAGILHRDVKANLRVTHRVRAKVLDFVAGDLLERKVGADQRSLPQLAEEGSTAGTPGYMSPEQLLGKTLDARSDLFSLGVVIYRMVTGTLPFEGPTKAALAAAVLNAEPKGFGDVAVPGKLREITRKLLEKEPAKRYASADEVRAELKALAEELGPAKGRLSRGTRLLLMAAGFVVVVAGGWFWANWSRERWALRAIPEIESLVQVGRWSEAADLVERARAVLPKDAALRALWLKATTEVTVETVPAGAEVAIRKYAGGPNAWRSLGRTPLSRIRVPSDVYVWRLSKPGFVDAIELGPSETVTRPHLRISFELARAPDSPPGMVLVPTGPTGLLGMGLTGPPGPLEGYLIDRTEVSNEEFRRFVDAGGYGNPGFWKPPFVEGGKTIPWRAAVSRFRDATGLPGPATWEAGAPPKGKENHPVAGVSWYEAAAYAEFAGKRLPPGLHWHRAAQLMFAHLVSPVSNFSGTGTRPVGAPGSLSGYGTADMAGNVKEWCWNERGEGKRLILGGGFGEPDYMLVESDAQSPWDRGPNFGFRCIKSFSEPPEVVTKRIERESRDYTKETPVSDEVFDVFRRLYAYEKGELNARLEEREETRDWTREKVSFDAAYGGERVIAHLCLPKNALPPFQVVVYFPGSGARWLEKLNTSDLWGNDFVMRSGRALLFPIYKSTYERRDGQLDYKGDQPKAWVREHHIAWSRDVGRSLDYLATRRDIDGSKIAYHGYSWGTHLAPIVLAVEDRFRAAVLAASGLPLGSRAPETDQINFITRVKVPTLLIGGRLDGIFPLETSQRPFYRLLGTPDRDKRFVICESGHVLPRGDLIRESLAWLDKYLGPVTPKSADR